MKEELFKIADYLEASPIPEKERDQYKVNSKFRSEIKAELLKCKRMAEYSEADELAKILSLCIKHLEIT